MTPEEKENILRAQARRCAEELTKAMSVKMTGDDMNTDLTNIKHFLNYNQETGIFTWLHPQGSKVKRGAIAGAVRPDGYVVIKICKKPYMAHRLAWLFIHGEWPASFIDHINLNRSDNRAINLRLATNSENMMNQSKRADNSSGVKGVDWHSRTKKWRARCMVSGVRHTVGMFNSKREAEKSIREFRNQVHGEFANHGVES